MGPPGSGKGTQANRIAHKLRVNLVATGDLFRQHQKNGTELGLAARGYMERGEYVPDDVTINMVLNWIGLPEQSNGFLLDGFPRTLKQAEELDKTLSNTGGVDRVLFINVTQTELIRRLAGRYICRECQTPYHSESSPPKKSMSCDKCDGELYQRKDDQSDVVAKRISVYFKETEPVVEHYRKRAKLVEIDGGVSIEDVADNLDKALLS